MIDWLESFFRPCLGKPLLGSQEYAIRLTIKRVFLQKNADRLEGRTQGSLHSGDYFITRRARKDL